MIPTLALDLARKTGWAVLSSDGKIIDSGTLFLSTPAEDDAQRKICGERFYDKRFEKLVRFIQEKVQDYGIERLVFEDVQFATSTMQVQLWTALRGSIWTCVFQNPALKSFAVSVKTLKKFASDHGDAAKDGMLEALIPIWGSVSDSSRHTDMMDDNEVDAIWMALYALAVDEGRECFLGPYARKQEEKRLKKEKKAAKVAEAGKCPDCKVRRKVLTKFIQCPKCGTRTPRTINV